jgi:hypothetical protein
MAQTIVLNHQYRSKQKNKTAWTCTTSDFLFLNTPFGRAEVCPGGTCTHTHTGPHSWLRQALRSHRTPGPGPGPALGTAPGGCRGHLRLGHPPAPCHSPGPPHPGGHHCHLRWAPSLAPVCLCPCPALPSQPQAQGDVTPAGAGGARPDDGAPHHLMAHCCTHFHQRHCHPHVYMPVVGAGVPAAQHQVHHHCCRCASARPHHPWPWDLTQGGRPQAPAQSLLPPGLHQPGSADEPGYQQGLCG